MLAGETGGDVDHLVEAMRRGELRLPPIVVTELLTDAKIAKLLAPLLDDLDLLEIREGYWRRAGETRSKLRSRGLKANVGDALIAQSCLDHDAPLVTRDEDFRHYEKHCGLRLA